MATININQNKIARSMKKFRNILIVLILIFVIVPLITSLNPFYTVEYGTVGVINRFGKIVGKSDPGLHFKLPFADEVRFYSTQKIIYQTEENATQSKNYLGNSRVSNTSSQTKVISDATEFPVDTTTSDGQQISIRYTIRYALDPEQILEIAEKIGTQGQVTERIVQAQSRSVTRNVAREFTAQQLYTEGINLYEDKVEQELKKTYEKNGVVLDEFLVRQIKFSPEYLTAIEAKQIASEQVKTEEFKAKQEEFKKEQVIIKAEGQAKAQEILKQSIDPLLLQKEAIQKWNGILPQYMGGGETPFINIK